MFMCFFLPLKHHRKEHLNLEIKKKMNYDRDFFQPNEMCKIKIILE